MSGILEGTSGNTNMTPAASMPEATNTGDTGTTPNAPETTQDDGQKDGTTETSIPVTSETQGTAEGQKPEGEGNTAPPAPIAIDPEIESYAKGKGIDAEVLKTNPWAQNLLKSSRESEAEMNRLRNELKATTEKGIAPQKPGEPANAEQSISPLTEVKQLYDSAIRS